MMTLLKHNLLIEDKGCINIPSDIRQYLPAIIREPDNVWTHLAQSAEHPTLTAPYQPSLSFSSFLFILSAAAPRHRSHLHISKGDILSLCVTSLFFLLFHNPYFYIRLFVSTLK